MKMILSRGGNDEVVTLSPMDDDARVDGNVFPCLNFTTETS